jgi:hypothetical protein
MGTTLHTAPRSENKLLPETQKYLHSPFQVLTASLLKVLTINHKIVLPALELYMNGIKQYMFFCVWLLDLIV